MNSRQVRYQEPMNLCVGYQPPRSVRPEVCEWHLGAWEVPTPSGYPDSKCKDCPVKERGGK